MKFNNIEPRTREERAALKDKEKIEDYRLKQRIGGYHKYVDNAQISQPDPISSHFISEAERFDKDFSSHDKKTREMEHQKKLEMTERKRVEKFERDLQRWKYMDDEEGRDQHKLEYMNEHYLTGKKNTGGAAYNVISLEYDTSKEGKRLKTRDDDAKVRALVRSKNIDMRSNCGYNIMTGDQRSGVYVPPHETYNPYEYNAAQNAGHEVVFGSGGQPQDNNGGYYEEQKADPAQQNYSPQQPQQDYAPQQQQQMYEAPAQDQNQVYTQQQPVQQNSGSRQNSRGGVGVQLPIAQKDYSQFGGGAQNEGAGVGMGYSQPMQAVQNFEGGTGSKFY
jgi:hypothetical protein